MPFRLQKQKKEGELCQQIRKHNYFLIKMEEKKK